MLKRTPRLHLRLLYDMQATVVNMQNIAKIICMGALRPAERSRCRVLVCSRAPAFSIGPAVVAVTSRREELLTRPTSYFQPQFRYER